MCVAWWCVFYCCVLFVVLCSLFVCGLLLRVVWSSVLVVGCVSFAVLLCVMLYPRLFVDFVYVFPFCDCSLIGACCRL